MLLDKLTLFILPDLQIYLGKVELCFPDPDFQFMSLVQKITGYSIEIQYPEIHSLLWGEAWTSGLAGYSLFIDWWSATWLWWPG